jgi:hypothetical protein
MPKIQDEITVLFVLVAIWVGSIPILTHFSGLNYFVQEGGVLAGFYGTFIAHEATKIIKSNRSADDE